MNGPGSGMGEAAAFGLESELLVGATSFSPQVLLIDLENCPSQIQQLLSDTRSFSRVLICYANGNPKIPLDWLTALAGAVQEGRLRIERMAVGGKNAADFGLCFHAGVLMASMPEETRFVIVSNDYHLDHAVNLLQTHGREAERIGAPKPETGITSGSVELTEYVADYARHLLAHSKTRPAKEDSLVNSVRVKFQIEAAPAAIIVKALVKASAVTVDQGKVTYNDPAIQQLAQSQINQGTN